ncbi:hypothetical protein [Alistipes sp. An66]|uniref:hypothetical protein n=1 Tax=Alistipes sp. An66 TaxID=1965650 RepID=UPI000B38196A|nr:hypothetical protein [Alistipes sp. An66]
MNYYALIELFGGFFVAWCIIGILVCISIVCRMAQNYGRSVGEWLLIAIFFSPIVAIIGLAALGKTLEKRFEEWEWMETRKRMARKEMDENNDYMNVSEAKLIIR